MAIKVKIRKQRVADAKRFYEILNNPNFKYFHICPKDVEAEKDFLRQNTKKRKNNIEYNYAILFNGKLVGGCGIKINQHRTFIGEIGYFLDEKYWGKGITTKAVKILEKIGFEELDLKRIEIIMDPRNIASEKVAIKCAYKKEGTMKKAIKDGDKFSNAYLYAKVKEVS
ncbi:GNAT family N-acetyltransferase [Patescibacteria group bacterium]|nr:GNAT family N-acetyltransferase [Patescibacteria group bacterium]